MHFDFGFNQGFVEEIYAQYLENPAAVDINWRKFFESQNGGAPDALGAKGSAPAEKAPEIKGETLVPAVPIPVDASFLDAVYAGPLPEGEHSREILEQASPASFI